MAHAALSSLLQTLESVFFGHDNDSHPNGVLPLKYDTIMVAMFKIEIEVTGFFAQLLDGEQRGLIILPIDIAKAVYFVEMIETKCHEFEVSIVVESVVNIWKKYGGDQIKYSSACQGEGSAERRTSDGCPLRSFLGTIECISSLTISLDYLIHRLAESMARIDPRSIKMIKIRKKNENLKVVGSVAATEIRSEEDIVIGIEKEAIKIKDLVIGSTSSRLEIISIVGMGGIGKTTLARVIYRDNRVSQHFDVRIWITVTQIYDARAVLLSLLIAGKEDHQQASDQELRTKVYRKLKQRRYLIIVDDIWHTHVWDDIRILLPDDCNGSRVVVTTRQTIVAEYASPEIFPVHVPLMDKATSWNLLEKRVFRDDNCPIELVDIGIGIAEKCHGLPLTIVAIAGLLQVNKTQDWWENIANDVKSVIYRNDEHHMFDILSLSYNHLPGGLQPCLLYFERFPEDEEISVSHLIKLWAAEGFLEPRESKNLEETGYECLEDLIRRNLVSTTNRKRRNGLPNKCFVHDIIREMCIKLSQGKFNPTRDILFISLHEVLYFTDEPPPGTGRENKGTKKVMEKGYELLRVLDAPIGRKDEFPYALSQISELVNLKYLTLHILHFDRFIIPTNICMFTNLETLVIRSRSTTGVRLPGEIWEMPKLRHLLIDGFAYIDSRDRESEASAPRESLETLLHIHITDSSYRILKRIPNIRKLGFSYFDGSLHFIEQLVHLRHLEILHLKSLPIEDHAWHSNIFPNSLKKLTMEHVKLPWEYLGRILGSLPNLEVLKLKNDACRGRVWETTEGHFSKLKMLEIEKMDLEIWRMDSSNDFPQLQHVRLSKMPEFEGASGVHGRSGHA